LVLRIIFMGSPEEVIFPLKALEAHCQKTRAELVAVVSQPARPAGRKRVATDPPLARYAKDQGLLVLQPESAKANEFLKELALLQPDIVVTAAYGQILSRDFLAIPKRATINLHPSLLPSYRGATPVQSALLAGEKETGVTILFTVSALDAGAIISQKKVKVDEHETTEVLLPRLFSLAGDMLPEALAKLNDESFAGDMQDEKKVSHCRKIQKSDGEVDWNLPAEAIYNRFRAFSPWPGSFTFWAKQRLVLSGMRPVEAEPVTLSPGQLLYQPAQKRLLVGTATNPISLIKIKPAGGTEVGAEAFGNRLQGQSGDHFFYSERGA